MPTSRVFGTNPRSLGTNPRSRREALFPNPVPVLDRAIALLEEHGPRLTISELAEGLGMDVASVQNILYTKRNHFKITTIPGEGIYYEIASTAFRASPAEIAGWAKKAKHLERLQRQRENADRATLRGRSFSG